MSASELDRHREEIDRIDKELVALLSRRATCAQAIGRAKDQDGGPIFVPHREKQVFDRVCAANEGPLPDKSLRAIWREIMSGSISLERPITICHFGSVGSFTNRAARAKFGDSVSYEGVEDIPTVFDAVERGQADYGVVPIENSTDGSITDTIDSFLATNLRIVNEIHLRISHNLMACCSFDSIKKIYSKHTAFGQCRHWLATHAPHAELVEIGSTTQAAQRAAEEEGAAAIGNKEAALEFGINVLAEDIQDNASNTTRFVVLALPERQAAPTGRDKTSIKFSLQDNPGALYDALLPLREAGISLARIESRPNRRQSWEYLFFIDLLGHKDDEKVAKAIDAFSKGCSSIDILGSYPRAEDTLN